jgi:heme/copper-type cytochrome/quinol oxidase subunit 2
MDNANAQQQTELLEMHLDYDGGNTLQETVRWSKFLAIVGIIGLGIYLLAVLVGGSFIGALVQQTYGLEGAGLVGLVIALIIFILAILIFVVVMLYRFSVFTRRGIDSQDQVTFNRGLKSLKTYFLINGIIGILYLLLTIFSTVIALI